MPKPKRDPWLHDDHHRNGFCGNCGASAVRCALCAQCFRDAHPRESPHDDHHSNGFCQLCGASATTHSRCGLCLFEATLGEVNHKPGKPASWGHHFGPELFCAGCGLRHSEHQRKPQMCRPAMERAGPMARRVG